MSCVRASSPPRVELPCRTRVSAVRITSTARPGTGNRKKTWLTKNLRKAAHFHESIRKPARTVNHFPNFPDPVNSTLRVLNQFCTRLPVKTPHHPPNAFSGAFAAPDFFCRKPAGLEQQGACARNKSSDKSRSSLERTVFPGSSVGRAGDC